MLCMHNKICVAKVMNYLKWIKAVSASGCNDPIVVRTFVFFEPWFYQYMIR